MLGSGRRHRRAPRPAGSTCASRRRFRFHVRSRVARPCRPTRNRGAAHGFPCPDAGLHISVPLNVELRMVDLADTLPTAIAALSELAGGEATPHSAKQDISQRWRARPDERVTYRTANCGRRTSRSPRRCGNSAAFKPRNADRPAEWFGLRMTRHGSWQAPELQGIRERLRIDALRVSSRPFPDSCARPIGIDWLPCKAMRPHKTTLGSCISEGKACLKTTSKPSVGSAWLPHRETRSHNTT